MNWDRFLKGLEQLGTEQYQKAKGFLTLPGRVYKGEPVSLEETTAFALGMIGGGIPGGGRGSSVAGTTILPGTKFPLSLQKVRYRQLTKKLDATRLRMESWKKREKHPLSEKFYKEEKSYLDKLIREKYKILEEVL